MFFMGNTVNKLLLIITGAVLLASISGTIMAFISPVEKEESINLANYQHKGEFDYIAYMKPSYLFSPELQELVTTSPSQKYFTEIIKSIDMTFTYVPEEEISAEVEVKAVLENHNVWQKEITLVPATTQTGGFAIEFPLDIEGLNQLFNTIDEELDIISLNREVTIVVNVINAEGVFTQRLPITLGENFIEIDNNLKLVESGASGEFDYTVYLRENTLFDTETLKPPPVTSLPPKTIGPGEILISRLVDRMDVTFSYSFRASEPLSQVSEEVEIIAVLENPEVWSKSFTLVPRTNKSGDFTITSSLYIDQVLEMLDAINSETMIIAQSYSLTITAYVHTMAETEFGPIDEVFSQSMDTTLGEGTLEWSDDLVSYKLGSIETSQHISNKLMGMSVVSARIVFPLLTSIFLASFLYFLVLYIKFGPAGLPEMEREALRAKRRYKDLIIDVQTLPKTLDNERVISLSSLDDLIITAEELGKVVLYKADIGKRTYCVIDAMVRYQYVSKLELTGKYEIEIET